MASSISLGSFQKRSLIIMIIILILSLVSIYILLRETKKEIYPPMIPECPDYWLLDGSGNCVNKNKMGTCNNQDGNLIVNFNESTFQGTDSTCQKYQWANTCGVSWDGITYGVQNPCNE